jgi:hypothetical protein
VCALPFRCRRVTGTLHTPPVAIRPLLSLSLPHLLALPRSGHGSTRVNTGEVLFNSKRMRMLSHRRSFDGLSERKQTDGQARTRHMQPQEKLPRHTRVPSRAPLSSPPAHLHRGVCGSGRKGERDAPTEVRHRRRPLACGASVASHWRQLPTWRRHSVKAKRHRRRPRTSRGHVEVGLVATQKGRI